MFNDNQLLLTNLFIQTDLMKSAEDYYLIKKFLDNPKACYFFCYQKIILNYKFFCFIKKNLSYCTKHQKMVKMLKHFIKNVMVRVRI